MKLLKILFIAVLGISSLGTIFAAADYSGQNLAGRVFNNMDLRGANFSNCNLRGAQLAGTALQEANLTNTNLREAQMGDANLTDAVITGVQWTGAYFNRNTKWPQGFNQLTAGMIGPRVDFSGQNLAGRVFNNLDLLGANFTNSNLRGAQLAGTALQEANFTNANLREAQIGDANLTDASVTGVQWTGAYFNRNTKWPQGFNPLTAGMIGPRVDFSGQNLTGNALNNGLTGNDGRNILDGGLGNDKLDGGAGADSLLGGVGNDAFEGGLGNDTMRGGEGVDLADFAAAGVDIVVDLATGRVTGDGTDLLFDIENILAGDGDDKLTGSAGANDLDGGAGIDSLNGGAGNDTMAGCFFGANGGRGERDTLIGGAGNDIFQLGWASGRFYDDGVTTNAGRNDYVLITDFTVGQDKLQLDGAASNYYLGASGVSGVTDTGLYAEQGATDELIAIIRSANSTVLNATNTINTAAFV